MTLVVPGLMGPMPGWFQFDEAPRFARLERWLSRASVDPGAGRDLEHTLCALFGLTASAGGDLPVAALRRAGDGGVVDLRVWMQVEPVCLHPDQSRLLLFDSLDFDFSLDEARQLAALFLDHFKERGWQLEVPRAECWFLGMAACPGLRTRPLGDAFGRNMDLFLPQGNERLAWHAVLNEVQMLFFDAAVNQRREAVGRMPVNGLWFSGVGRLPQQLDSPFDLICGDDPLARGLGRVSITERQGLPVDTAALTALSGRLLLVDTRLQRPVWSADPYAWSEQINRFETWLEGLVEGVRQGAFRELVIHPCNGRKWIVTRASLRRVWRRPRALLRIHSGDR